MKGYRSFSLPRRSTKITITFCASPHFVGIPDYLAITARNGPNCKRKLARFPRPVFPVRVLAHGVEAKTIIFEEFVSVMKHSIVLLPAQRVDFYYRFTILNKNFN